MFRPPVYITPYMTPNYKRKIQEKNVSKVSRILKRTKRIVGTTCRENVRKYLFNTTLHGLKYVGDRSLSTIEQ